MFREIEKSEQMPEVVLLHKTTGDSTVYVAASVVILCRLFHWVAFGFVHLVVVVIGAKGSTIQGMTLCGQITSVRATILCMLPWTL